jgi:hypothetical protein
MKTNLFKSLLTLLPITGCLFLADSAAAQFVPGNLAVIRLGDGTQTLANTGNSVFIDQYTVSGSLVNSVAIPDSGASALIMSGTATAEGALVRSANGLVLTFGGYNTTRPYASSLPNTGAGTVARAVGQVDASGNYTLVTTTSTMFGGSGATSGQLRSVVTDGNNDYWGVGTSSAASTRGAYYFGLNASPAVITNSVSPRVVDIVGGNLTYSISSSSAGVSGIWRNTGLPTATQNPIQMIFTGDGSSPYDFAFNPTMTLAYVADDRSIASGGGIQRWEFNSGAWSLTYTLGTGAGSTVGARSLAVDFSGSAPVIFAVTAETSNNRLITLVDTGAGSPATTLASAGANRVFRGLDFVPIPEPSSYAIIALGVLLIGGRLRAGRSR